VLESIVTLGAGCNAVPIAEGIEQADDLAVLRDLGIQHFQGWLWAPSMAPAEIAASPLLQLPSTAR
jgi:EAL domain-containing protein (putative c-di-GMP-specific phosphodiesterase class I)